MEIEISPKLKPYLLQLKKHFTSYKLKQVNNFKSSYSIRIYELSIQFEHQQSVEFDINKFYDLIGHEINQKYGFGHFNAKILKPCIKEINKYSDMNLSVELTRKLRKVVKIKLNIECKPKMQKSISNDNQHETKEPVNDIFKVEEEPANSIFKFKKEPTIDYELIQDVKQFINKHLNKESYINDDDSKLLLLKANMDKSIIENALNAVIEYSKTHDINSLMGIMIKALDNGWGVNKLQKKAKTSPFANFEQRPESDYNFDELEELERKYQERKLKESNGLN